MSQDYLRSNLTIRYHGSLLEGSGVLLWKAASLYDTFCCFCILILIHGFPLILPYIFTVLLMSDGDGKGQSIECITPSYPNKLPVLGHSVSFALDMAGTITRFACEVLRHCYGYTC